MVTADIEQALESREFRPDLLWDAWGAALEQTTNEQQYPVTAMPNTREEACVQESLPDAVESHAGSTQQDEKQNVSETLLLRGIETTDKLCPGKPQPNHGVAKHDPDQAGWLEKALEPSFSWRGSCTSSRCGNDIAGQNQTKQLSGVLRLMGAVQG